MAGTVLIVDDIEKLSRNLARNFRDLGYEALTATNSDTAIRLIEEHPIQVVLLDVTLGGESGLDLLERLQTLAPELSVVMITGYATVQSAVQAMKLGALDFVEKPLDFDRLAALVEKGCHLTQTKAENHSLKKRLAALTPRLVTQDPVLLATCEKAKQLADTDLPILTLGESGTGKELMAEFIHAHSARRFNDLHQVNCAAFADNLLDDELFGHEKGAFTGAQNSFPGVFERANRATLHLDEIGDMALTTQAKILRVLQNQEVKRIGSDKLMKVDVRFIASTNRDLHQLMEQKLFRSDLFFRLNGATLRIPPLRERMGDVPLLLDHLGAQFAESHGTAHKKITPEAMERLMTYSWPGNVRELKNVVSYAVAVARNAPAISLEHLPSGFWGQHSEHGENNEMIGHALEETEKQTIEKTLRATSYNKKRTAEILGVSRNTLYKKIQKYELS